MKRKVIQLAGKTLVVSLPSKWAKKCGIKKGEEIDVLESENSLIINSDKKNVASSICLDVSGLNSSLLWHYLVASYVKGVAEIELRFSSKEIFNPRTKNNVNTVNFIANVVDSLIGMELVRHGNNFCIIKEISSIKIDEFNTVLKRLFFNICTFSSDVFSALQRPDISVLENTKYVEQNINKLSVFCLRALNKDVCDKNADASGYYISVNSLEEIGDSLYTLVKIAIKEKLVTEKTKILPEMFEKTNINLHKMQNLFYDFEKSRCVEFYDENRALKEQIESAQSNAKNNSPLLHLLELIREKSMAVVSARMMLAV